MRRGTSGCTCIAWTCLHEPRPAPTQAPPGPPVCRPRTRHYMRGGHTPPLRTCGTLWLLAGTWEQRDSKAEEQSPYGTAGNALESQRQRVVRCLLISRAQSPAGRVREQKNFIFTSFEVTFSRSLLIMMLRSLALMSRSVRSLSVGLERKSRGCLQAGHNHTAQLVQTEEWCKALC